MERDFVVADILDTYRDSRIDFVDATVMAIGERFDCKIVLTLDRRDFQIFRPSHCEWFEILPGKMKLWKTCIWLGSRFTWFGE